MLSHDAQLTLPLAAAGSLELLKRCLWALEVCKIDNHCLQLYLIPSIHNSNSYYSQGTIFFCFVFFRGLYLPRPPLCSSRPIIVGGAPPADAWTPPHRLYGVAERLILLVAGLGVGVEIGEVRRGGRDEGGGTYPAPPPPFPPSLHPHSLLGVGAGAWCWAAGSQHIVLPSQPVCNLSHVCNECWKRDCGGKKGGRKWGKKEQLRGRFWSFFFSPSCDCDRRGINLTLRHQERGRLDGICWKSRRCLCFPCTFVSWFSTH